MKKLYTIKALCPSEKTLNMIRLFAYTYRPIKSGSPLATQFGN